MKLLYIHDTKVDSEKANLIQVVQMCHAFVKNNVEVILALPDVATMKNKGEYKEFIREKFGIDINFSLCIYNKIRLFGKFNFIGGYFGVKKLLENLAADICFIRNASFIGPVIEIGMPFLYESHNTILHEGSKLSNIFWTKRLIKHSHNKKLVGFITISQALADYWGSKGIPKDKIIALHDGFIKDKFKEVKIRSVARKELELPSNTKIVMYIGSLYRDRGIEQIIKLSQEFSDTLFVVVGGPENEKKYYEKISYDCNLKNIIFRGRVPHHSVPNYLFAADVLLMIWTEEVKTINYCSPLKTFEYMASGRIIVGHSFPTILEVLEDGKTALLANPNDFNSLKEKLHIALNDDAVNKIAEKARSLAFQKYSWDQRAKSIINQILRFNNSNQQ